jgi:ATP-dependent DNA ligase I
MSEAELRHEPARLADLVATSAEVRATRARLEKRARLRALFSRLDALDLRLAATYLAGEIPQGSLQVGWSALGAAIAGADVQRALPLFAAVAETPRESPTLREVDRTFERLHRITGPGSAGKRKAALLQLPEPVAEDSRCFLTGLLLGELRQGALRALVLEALAEAFAADAEALRRAVMFAGSLGEVVDTLARDGPAALQRFGPRPGVPVEPMLAASADDLRGALESFGGRAAVEWKLDGVRIQMHRGEEAVRVFSRALRDVTHLVPEVRELGALPAKTIILDGEVIGYDAAGRPLPFQDLMSRFSREEKGMLGAPEAPARLAAFFFDVLELDGMALVDRPYAERRRLLSQILAPDACVPQREVDSVDAAEAVYREALAAGHEGVVVKALEGTYTAGRRGAAWRKVKPAVALDLVILAAEWGHGRRQGFLSNLHLGARDASDAGRFHRLGKTFKGLTDVMLQEMTNDLLQLETHREGHIVHVRPVRVVEIAFDAVQRSPRYDSGFALRFARVKRFRPDKNAGEADTIDTVRRLFAGLR